MGTRWMNWPRRLAAGVALSVMACGWVVGAEYNNPGPFAEPVASTTQIPRPARVPGKEYSTAGDTNSAGAADPHQVIAWDGVPGNAGVLDGPDFTAGLSERYPLNAGLLTAGIDGLSNYGDALFAAALNDQAALVFSVAGSGDLWSSRAEDGEVAIWAKANQINAMNPPMDVDGLELWGLEPPLGDANRYSLAGDPAADGVTRVSVFTESGGAYVAHDDIVAAVTLLLGAADAETTEAIDVDAMMTLDDEYDGVFGPLDAIIFSIARIEGYATGQELFVMTGDGVVDFLFQGGHFWDTAWAIENPLGDINALDAVAPVPSSVWAGGVILVAMGVRRWWNHHEMRR